MSLACSEYLVSVSRDQTVCGQNDEWSNSVHKITIMSTNIIACLSNIVPHSYRRTIPAENPFNTETFSIEEAITTTITEEKITA